MLTSTFFKPIIRSLSKISTALFIMTPLLATPTLHAQTPLKQTPLVSSNNSSITSFLEATKNNKLDDKGTKLLDYHKSLLSCAYKLTQMDTKQKSAQPNELNERSADQLAAFLMSADLLQRSTYSDVKNFLAAYTNQLLTYKPDAKENIKYFATPQQCDAIQLHLTKFKDIIQQNDNQLLHRFFNALNENQESFNSAFFTVPLHEQCLNYQTANLQKGSNNLPMAQMEQEFLEQSTGILSLALNLSLFQVESLSDFNQTLIKIVGSLRGSDTFDPSSPCKQIKNSFNRLYEFVEENVELAQLSANLYQVVFFNK